MAASGRPAGGDGAGHLRVAGRAVRVAAGREAAGAEAEGEVRVKIVLAVAVVGVIVAALAVLLLFGPRRDRGDE